MLMVGRYLEVHVSKSGISIQVIHIFFTSLCKSRNSAIDAFLRNDDPASQAIFNAIVVVGFSELPRVLNGCITVVE